MDLSDPQAGELIHKKERTMRCSKCTDNPVTVGEVLACKICRDDGTANEIPKDLPPEHALWYACERKPGLQNRFTAVTGEGGRSSADAVATAELAPPAGGFRSDRRGEAARPEPAKPKSSKRKPPDKPARKPKPTVKQAAKSPAKRKKK